MLRDKELEITIKKFRAKYRIPTNELSKMSGASSYTLGIILDGRADLVPAHELEITRELVLDFIEEFEYSRTILEGDYHVQRN